MTSVPVRAAVVGCTGYIGMQCVRLLAAHPGVELTQVCGRSAMGRRYGDVVPGSDLTLTVTGDVDAAAVDVVFAALPHTVAATQAQGWLDAGAVLVDLSADFRVADPADFLRWYGSVHPAPKLCAEAVYALVEVGATATALRDARLIAAPGCYPTAALLGVLPLLHAGLVGPRIVVDAKSGVSGAGRSPSLTTHFAEANEAVRAYAVGGHRHGAEMRSRLELVSDAPVALTFVPHLVPMTRGLLATIYLEPLAAVTALAAHLRELCAAHPFLRYQEEPPSTKSVLGSNVAALNCSEQEGTAVVTVAIDNLLKGAAGQAVQAMNIRFGLQETDGLLVSSPWP